MIFDEPKNSDVDITEMIIPAILINVVSMFIAFLVVKIFKIEKGQVLAISIESGLKNSAIGLMIATTFLKIGEVELLILAYSFISFYLTFVLSLLLKRIS
jgi:predicted Na+-dependent transporter